MIYAWQQQQWQHLMQLKAADVLPHALLLSGIPGLGKSEFTKKFVQAILCQKPVFSQECTCRSCELIEAHTHPNVLMIKPEKTGQAIKIDDIRLTTNFITQTGLMGKWQIVIINPANLMNTHAANALLKTLEEPSPHSLLLLIDDRTKSLPSTITSRCQSLQFHIPMQACALAWLNEQNKNDGQNELVLNLAYGAPLAALALLQTGILPLRKYFYDHLSKTVAQALTCADQMKDAEIALFLDLMLVWLIDILRVQLNAHARITNLDYQQEIVQLAQRTTSNNISDFITYLSQLRKQYKIGINFNKQMLFENVLLKWYQNV